jgi:ribA/ribD-fused uncharacterized protein
MTYEEAVQREKEAQSIADEIERQLDLEFEEGLEYQRRYNDDDTDSVTEIAKGVEEQLAMDETSEIEDGEIESEQETEGSISDTTTDTNETVKDHEATPKESTPNAATTSQETDATDSDSMRFNLVTRKIVRNKRSLAQMGEPLQKTTMNLGSKLGHVALQNLEKDEDLDTRYKDAKLEKFFTKASPFSNHHKATITIDGKTYAATENYLFAMKAHYVAAHKVFKQIVNSDSPALARKLGGGSLVWYHKIAWPHVAYGLLYKANAAKHGQHRILREKLLEMAGRRMVECNPHTTAYGGSV